MKRIITGIIAGVFLLGMFGACGGEPAEPEELVIDNPVVPLEAPAKPEEPEALKLGAPVFPEFDFPEDYVYPGVAVGFDETIRRFKGDWRGLLIVSSVKDNPLTGVAEDVSPCAVRIALDGNGDGEVYVRGAAPYANGFDLTGSVSVEGLFTMNGTVWGDRQAEDWRLELTAASSYMTEPLYVSTEDGEEFYLTFYLRKMHDGNASKWQTYDLFHLEETYWEMTLEKMAGEFGEDPADIPPIPGNRIPGIPGNEEDWKGQAGLPLGDIGYGAYPLAVDGFELLYSGRYMNPVNGDLEPEVTREADAASVYLTPESGNTLRVTRYFDPDALERQAFEDGEPIVNAYESTFRGYPCRVTMGDVNGQTINARILIRVDLGEEGVLFVDVRGNIYNYSAGTGLALEELLKDTELMGTINNIKIVWNFSKANA
jgi:hypothetical protein